MPLRRLVYYSTKRLSPAGGPPSAQIADIMKVSVVNNRRFNVTGALIYDDTWFSQALEGETEAIRIIFGKIRVDHRHSDIVLVENVAVPERLFASWWMTPVVLRDAPKLTVQRFTGDSRFDPRAMSGGHLVGLMEAVLEEDARSPMPAGVGAAAYR